MTDTDDNTDGCDTNYRQIEWKYFLFAVAAVRFIEIRFFLLFFDCFYSNPIWLNVQRNFICKLIDRVTQKNSHEHNHFVQFLLWRALASEANKRTVMHTVSERLSEFFFTHHTLKSILIHSGSFSLNSFTHTLDWLHWISDPLQFSFLFFLFFLFICYLAQCLCTVDFIDSTAQICDETP